MSDYLDNFDQIIDNFDYFPAMISREVELQMYIFNPISKFLHSQFMLSHFGCKLQTQRLDENWRVQELRGTVFVEVGVFEKILRRPGRQLKIPFKYRLFETCQSV